MVSQLRIFGDLKSTTVSVRGKQMADYLGASFNEPANAEDIVICMKCLPESFRGLRKVYIDPGDDPVFVKHVVNKMSVGCCEFDIIASQERMARMLRTLTGRRVIVIPEFHCNHERQRTCRPDRSKVVWVGNRLGIDCSLLWLRERFRYDLGMELRVLFYDSGEELTREQLCNELMEACIGIDFRKDKHASFRHPDMLTYLKVINYAAFGMPTVCYPREIYLTQGFASCIHPVFDVDGIIEACKLLKEDNDYYDMLSARAVELAENYHISKTAECYKALLEER